MDAIKFEDFQKLDIRIAKIINVEDVPETDNLLKLTLDVGDLGERTIVSGIKKWYKPDDLVGRLIVYLANLEPKVFKGIESAGMLLAAGEDEAILLSPDKEAETGAKIH